MDKINWPRVVLGGIVSGVVLIVLATTSMAFFSGQQKLRGMARALGGSPSALAAPLFLVFVFFSLGILLTGTYAAIRPRFGPGPRTAAVAGFAVWLTGVWLSLVAFALKSVVLGESYPLPSGPALPCMYLVAIVTSTLTGAWVYKEQQS